jgi:hypothetical protein
MIHMQSNISLPLPVNSGQGREAEAPDCPAASEHGTLLPATFFHALAPLLTLNVAALLEGAST